MKYVAVIDTNVVVSALITPNSNSEKIISYIEQGKIIPVYSVEIMDEYIEVLNRDKFHFSKQKIEKVIGIIKERGRILNGTETDEFFTDPSDIKFFEVALTANIVQDSFLVTGNLKHFPKTVFVVNPAMMVRIVKTNK